MAFNTFNEDMDIISKLGDEPNENNGLTAAGLKAKFDLAGNKIKTFLNNLIATMAGSTGAANIGFNSTDDVPETNVQDAIENVQAQLIGITQTGVANGSITTAKLAYAAVTTEKLGDASVTTEKLDGESVTTAKLADAAVTTPKLNDASVTSAKLADSSVTTTKLNNSAVTTAKLGDNAVTGAKVAKNTLREKVRSIDEPIIAEAYGTHATGHRLNMHYIKSLGMVFFEGELYFNNVLATGTLYAIYSLDLGTYKPDYSAGCAVHGDSPNTIAEYGTANFGKTLTISLSGVTSADLGQDLSARYSGWYICEEASS